MRAEPLYLRALRIWERAFGPDYPEVAGVPERLAALYANTGEAAKQWLKDNAEKYRIQRFVADKKDDK